MSPAETLRAAATLIRDTASKAAQGHPVPWHAEPEFNGWWHVATPAPHLVTSAAREPVAAWIALMHPGLAETLAAWLEHAAGDLTTAAIAVTKWPDGKHRDAADYIDEPDSAERALAFARQILGRTP